MPFGDIAFYERLQQDLRALAQHGDVPGHEFHSTQKASAQVRRKVLNAKEKSRFTKRRRESLAKPRYGLMRPMKKPFKTIALIGKYKSPEIAKPLLELGAFLEKRGMN